MVRRLKTETEKEVVGDVAVAPPIETPVKEWPLIVRKQANRLLRLFELPEDHPGRDERIKEYQDALVRNGVTEPPLTITGAQLLIDEVGEFNG